MDIITKNGVFTEIPYLELPLSTNGCPPVRMPLPTTFRHHSRSHSGTTTLYKNPSSELRSKGTTTTTTSSKSPRSQAPLITTCDVMPRVVASLNSAPDEIFDCTGSPPPSCSQINCNITGTGDTLEVNFLPCSSQPSLQLVVRNSSRSTLTNLTLNASTHVNVSISNGSVPLNVSIVQHTTSLSIGISVSSRVYYINRTYTNNAPKVNFLVLLINL